MSVISKPKSHQPNIYYDYVLSHYKNTYHQAVNTYFSKYTMPYDSKILKSALEPNNYYKYQYIVTFHPEKIFIMLPHISHPKLYEDDSINEHTRTHLDDWGMFFEFDLKSKVLRTNLENKKALIANKFFNIVSRTIKYFYKNKPSASFLKDYALTQDDVCLMTELSYLQKLNDDELKDTLAFSDIIYHFDAKYDFKSSGKYIDIYGHTLNEHHLITDDARYSRSFGAIPAFENERDKLYLGGSLINNVGRLSDKIIGYLNYELLRNIKISGFYTEPSIFTAPYIFIFVKGRKFEFLHPFKTKFTRYDSSFSSIVMEAPYLIPNYYTSFEESIIEANAIEKTSILNLINEKENLDKSIAKGLSIYRKFGEQLKEENEMFKTRHLAFKEIINQTIDIFQAEIDRPSATTSTTTSNS